jgi:hypothetical protein
MRETAALGIGCEIALDFDGKGKFKSMNEGSGRNTTQRFPYSSIISSILRTFSNITSGNSSKN